MPLFNLHYTAGFDLGTYKLRIVKDGNLICNERTSLVREPDTHRILIMGDEVYKHELGELKITNPVHYTLANFEAGEQLVHQVIKMYIPEEQRLFLPKSIDAYVAIPGHASEVDLRAYRDSLEHMNAKETHFVYNYSASAIGMKLLPEKRHFIVIDFSASKMEISLFYDGKPIEKGIVRMGSLKMEASLTKYIKKKYNIIPPQDQLWHILKNYMAGNAEKILRVVGFTITMHELEEILAPYFFFYDELLQECVENVSVNERSKIFENGIYFSGGGTYFQGICKRMAAPLKLPHMFSHTPDLDVIHGIKEIIKNPEKFNEYIFK